MKHSLKNSLSILALAATCASAAVFTPYSASAQVQAQPAEAAPVTGVPGWAIASDSIQADPNVVFGTLPNGMRFALQRHATPKGDVAVRFAINAGSKDETDAQRGAAHFVEHMAFNGSKNIPEGQLLPKLQRLGLSFGADTNATTSLEFTSYKLDLPNSQPEVIDAALLMMREVADRLTIAPAAVERERGILLSEASVRNDPNRRRIVNVLETQLPGNRLAGSIAQDPDQIPGFLPKNCDLTMKAIIGRSGPHWFLSAISIQPNCSEKSRPPLPIGSPRGLQAWTIAGRS